MKKALLVLMLILIFSPLALAHADGPIYYFIKVEGNGGPFFKLSINGKTIMEGTPIDKYNIPLHVTRDLKNGINRMQVEYLSDEKEALTIILEGRERRENKKTGQVLFTSPAGESQGKIAKKEIQFKVELTLLNEGMFIMSDHDRQSIKELVRNFYNAISKKDKRKALAFFETAAKEEGVIYPEYVKFYLDTLASSFDQLFPSPEFKMEPLELKGFMFKTRGEIATASHADGSPIFQSREVEVMEDMVYMEDGVETHKKTKVKTKIEPESFAFKKYNGKWEFSFDY